VTRFLSPADVAAEMGVSLRQAQRWIKRMPHFIEGRIVRVSREVFSTWVAENPAGGPAGVMPLDPWYFAGPAASGVYLVQARDESGPIKIGFSSNIANRVKLLQTNNGYPLRVLRWFAAGGKALEQRLHGRFAAHRLHCEWFAPAPEILLLARGIE
jgi:hypothetical protein